MDNQFIILSYNKKTFDKYIVGSFADYSDAKEYIKMIKNNKNYENYFFILCIYDRVKKTVDEILTQDEV